MPGSLDKILFLSGPILHLIFLSSVFDIHFKSPIVTSPISAPPPELSPPTDRLVLFVADGLRAESFYQPDAAPYLHRMGTSGVMGLSHTKVPTESRPGHVALLAGLYEDPSAITRGWTENPVEFDSVMNKSTHSWSWGSPDILPMFGRGASEGQVDMEMYDPEFENFASKDSSSLDIWVFNRVRDFLSRCQLNTKLDSKVKQEGNFFFLHLLGCDTNGHVHKPHSKQYKDNIKIVDREIEQLVKELKEFFGSDNRTTFLFTADHGMTDWGSHGAGMDQETVTPLVMWGSGIRWQGMKTLNTKIVDLSKYPVLETSNNVVSEVRQADLAPVMSTLLGRNIPENSAGRLPVHLIQLDKKDRAAAIKSQVNQLLGQYIGLRKRHEEILLPSLFHSEFKELSEDTIPNIENKISHLQSRLDWDEALKKSEELLDSLEEGIKYYQRYQAATLTLFIQAAYVGCIVFNMLNVLEDKLVHKSSHSGVMLTWTVIGCLLVVCHLCQRLPSHWLIYYLAPVFIWSRVTNRIFTRHIILPSMKNSLLPMLLVSSGTLAIISVGFTKRHMFSIGMLLLPLLISKKPLNNPAILGIATVLAVFPSLPVIDGRDRSLLTVLIVGVIVSVMSYMTRSSGAGLSANLMSLSPLLAGISVFLSGQFEGHSVVLQLITWVLFISSIPMGVCSTYSGLKLGRVNALSLGLVTIYILLSLSWEALLLPLLMMLLYFWVRMEDQGTKKGKEEGDLMTGKKAGRHFNLRDSLLILSYFFLNFYSFFATGNIASLNSFDPSSIRCFVAVFNPFLMGSLLLIKVLLPFLCLSINMLPVLHSRGLTQGDKKIAMSSTLQMFTDILGLFFFCQVTHTGSWLEIGTSLSHFVIVEGTSLAIALFQALARLLVYF